MPKNHEVVWSDAFSVGSQLIDNQHKSLVRMTNELFQGCERHDETLAFMRVIQSAVNYAKTHFATEERFMQKTNYPEAAIHKAEHEAFVVELLKQVREFEKGSCAPIDFALYLKNWLLNHIAVSDKKYAPYLKNIKDEEFAPK